MKKAAHVVFRGRVQGVFFRANTRENARKMGITGWVRNKDDGSVEAFFEGEADDVSRLVSEMAGGTGMGAARVEEKQLRWTEPEGYTGFDVLR